MNPALEEELDPGMEERSRLAVIAASVPLILLAAPCFLPFDHGRSLLAEGRYRADAILTLSLFFGWPVFVGALGLWRALKTRPPGRGAFYVPAAVVTLGAGVGVAGLSAVLVGAGSMRSSEAPFVISALVAWVGVLAMIVRGIRRRGFKRWVSLVAAVWLAYAGVFVLLNTGYKGMLEAPPGGLWVVLFALGAAAPPLAWGVSRKR